MGQELKREDVSDDMPLRLDLAARLAFPDGSIGLSGLRREAARGNLEVFRVAGKHMTTLRAIRDMLEKCRVKPNLPASGSSQPATTVELSGSSLIEEGKSARAALNLRLERLRGNLPTTSQASETPARRTARATRR